MIALLGLIFGAIARLAPEILKILNAQRDREHEYRMTQLQLQIDQARAQQQLDLVHAQGAIAQAGTELQGLIDTIQAQARATGIGWVDAVSSTVRPFLTFWWCVIQYTVYKSVLIWSALSVRADLLTLAGIVCTEWDRGVIASMISFWFVDRSLRR
jgi:hypothetical protein